MVITPQIVEKQPIAKFTARFCFSVRGFVDFAAALLSPLYTSAQTVPHNMRGSTDTSGFIATAYMGILPE